MLALAWRHGAEREANDDSLARGLGSSLCAGIGGTAGVAEIDGLSIAFRPLHSNPPRNWRPCVLPSRKVVLFNGYFDNSAEIASELGTDTSDPARLYGLAVERWQHDADRHVIGYYCAIVGDQNRLRLSRSPLRAPPLYYHHDDHLTAAASVPRALFAAGVEPQLCEARLADIALRNFHDEEASPYEGVHQVPTGSVVDLERQRPRTLRKWYDVLQIPQISISDADAIARVQELLDEGVRACLAGFRRPGSTLSGGLDSPQIAIKALAALPAGQKLPTFTFHPLPEYDGRSPRWLMPDERPFVDAFTAMHPGLEPHFTSNDGYEHDHRWKEFFHLMGDPAGLISTYVYHGILSEAAKAECDLLLVADWGNVTFSDRGDCGFVEYLLSGRWRQLWLALAGAASRGDSIGRRLLARSISALLPNRAWGPLRQLAQRKALIYDLAQPLSSEYRRRSGADERFRRSGAVADRYQPWSRRHSRKLLFSGGDSDTFYQGLEQMYGIALRDPTTYRPFVEFCLSLPTRMFLRNGESRWLAKQMAKGFMPEVQRTNPLMGWWDADWHVRIGRRRRDWLQELDRMHHDPRLANMIDLPRLRAALEDWPDCTEVEPVKFATAQLAVPSALAISRFIDFVERRNA